VGGTAIPNSAVDLLLKRERGEIVYSASVESDNNGNWQAKLDLPLKSGKYFVEATARDKRGALSLPALSEVIRVRERPLLTIAGIGITQFWLFAGLTGILLVGIVIGWVSYGVWKRRVARRVVVAQRDLVGALGILEKDIDKMILSYVDEEITEAEASEIGFRLKQTKNNLEKLRKYLLEGIEEIDD
jgi:hypothetical protein